MNGQFPIPAAPLRVYSDIVKAGLIRPKKERYTLADVRATLIDGLFRGGRTLTVNEARAVVVCSAHFHETDYTRAVKKAPIA